MSGGWMGDHKGELLTAAALGALAIGTGGFGLAAAGAGAEGAGLLGAGAAEAGAGAAAGGLAGADAVGAGAGTMGAMGDGAWLGATEDAASGGGGLLGGANWGKGLDSFGKAASVAQKTGLLGQPQQQAAPNLPRGGQEQSQSPGIQSFMQMYGPVVDAETLRRRLREQQGLMG